MGYLNMRWQQGRNSAEEGRGVSVWSFFNEHDHQQSLPQ